MKTLATVLFTFLGFAASAQFAPQAGQPGSTAISATSADIVAWATNCSVRRGFINIASPSSGYVSTGDSIAATGPANGTIVCLGDSGTATLSFAAPIYNGAGADLAVFENGFKDPANNAMAFLELAFVEVSSDGINFTRFHAVSNTPTNTQIPGSGVYMDAALINNLAGKYVATFGTPFDLAELEGTPGLDVNNITHIRLVDVIGSVTSHSCLDNEGKMINDPYPTNFPTGGFDLDAVAAIHMHSTLIGTVDQQKVTVFPNPANDLIHVVCSAATSGTLRILSGIGVLLKETELKPNGATIPIADLPSGTYYTTITNEIGNTQWAGNFIKL